MTFDEVGKKLAEGVTTIVIPVGVVEQHGYAAPLGTDTYGAALISRRVAEKLNCFCAPALAYGSALESRPYAGTISLQLITLAQVLKEIGLSLAKQGFKTIVFING